MYIYILWLNINFIKNMLELFKLNYNKKTENKKIKFHKKQDKHHPSTIRE
jgi:hypothetical protein